VWSFFSGWPLYSLVFLCTFFPPSVGPPSSKARIRSRNLPPPSFGAFFFFFFLFPLLTIPLHPLCSSHTLGAENDPSPPPVVSGEKTSLGFELPSFHHALNLPVVHDSYALLLVEGFREVFVRPPESQYPMVDAFIPFSVFSDCTKKTEADFFPLPVLFENQIFEFPFRSRSGEYGRARETFFFSRSPLTFFPLNGPWHQPEWFRPLRPSEPLRPWPRVGPSGLLLFFFMAVLRHPTHFFS